MYNSFGEIVVVVVVFSFSNPSNHFYLQIKKLEVYSTDRQVKIVVASLKSVCMFNIIVFIFIKKIYEDFFPPCLISYLTLEATFYNYTKTLLLPF